MKIDILLAATATLGPSAISLSLYKTYLVIERKMILYMETYRICQRCQVEQMKQQMKKVLISYGVSRVKVVQLGQYR